MARVYWESLQGLQGVVLLFVHQVLSGSQCSSRAILDQVYPVEAAEGSDGVQVARFAIEVNGDHGLHRSVFMELIGQVFRAQYRAAGSDVYEDRDRLHTEHCCNGGIGRVGRQHHLVTRSHVGASQGELQGVGSAGHSDHLLGAQLPDEPGGEGRLETTNALSEDQLAGAGHPLGGVGEKMAVAAQFLLGEVERVAHRR
jgi:hypothetical protein